MLDLDAMVAKMRTRRLEAAGMVLVFDQRGELLYASAGKCMAYALEEVAEVYELRGAAVKVKRCSPRPWSTVPFTLNILNLMTSAEA